LRANILFWYLDTSREMGTFSSSITTSFGPSRYYKLVISKI
jgi:hypothetical protein